MEESRSANIIFMGTPEFAVPTLERLHEEFGVKAVVTVPDKPMGRGKKLHASAVKKKAMEMNIPVLQPEKLKDQDFTEEFRNLQPDIICVLAFRILPEEVYSAAKTGAFNIHASLLPKYRGAAPINWAIINGEEETGLTSFLLKKKVDTGDIIMQHTIKIPENATVGDLHDIMMPEAARIAVATTKLLLKGEYVPVPQDSGEATPAPKIFREQCEINWDGHARDIKNFIHGVSPVPGAWTIWDGEIFKIFRTEYSACGNGEPGVFWIEDDSFFVNCRKGIIKLKEIQIPGKRKMKTEDFLAGYRGPKKGKFNNS